MAQTAIIDTASRIIKRLTIDDIPTYDPTTETAVTLVSPITLSGYEILGLDNQTLTVATAQQVQQAGLDDTYNYQQRQLKIQNLKTAITNLKNDPTVSDTVKQAFQGIIQVFLS